MDETIEYYIKDVWGNKRSYIADKETAENISLLTGQKTLDARHFQALEALGFTFKQVLAP